MKIINSNWDQVIVLGINNSTLNLDCVDTINNTLSYQSINNKDVIFHSLDCSDNDSDLSYQSISSQINEKLEDELNFHTLIPDCDYNEFEKSIKIFENKPEKETNLNLNSTLKSESVGMRPPLLTAKPINSVNMQEISDNLEKIEHLLLNRKEDQEQVSSSTFKSMNKSTKHQLSSITSTPAKITSSPSTDPNIDQNDKNQFFNQDSFLLSISDRGDNDIETSINIFENNTEKSKNFK